MNVRAGNDQRAEVLDRLTRALDTRELPIDEYDRRVAAIGTATYVTELVAQLRGLPPEYGWQPHPAATPITPKGGTRPGRTALILGVLSVPASMCLVGAIFGVLAILYSRRGPARGFGAALIGRTLGIVGILLSAGAGFAMWYALTHRLGA
jgi:Domain of unknown function (DUF1707)